MVEWLAGLQPALVGGVLLWAGGLKLLAPSAPAAARRSALSRLVGARRAVPAYRLVGCAELAVAAMLIAPPAHPAEALAAVALGLGMLGYLSYARVAAPRSSCGCLATSHAAPSRRGFARAGVLTVAGAVAVAAAGWWPGAVGQRPPASAGVLAAELAALVLLSAELDRYWLPPLRRLRLRLSHPLARRGLLSQVPLRATLQQLYQSPAYRSLADVLGSGPLDTWEDNQWRILTYAARTPAGPTTAVFAVPRLRHQPRLVRVAVVLLANEPKHLKELEAS